ncbi:MAG TPA: N-acetylmuramoyl-L-alanine amidase [Thermoanaerobaculia bacterium]|nr:N-acetylmuramoyl-L-alanine amidase [Thermoanaerobaculia bacterium]
MVRRRSPALGLALLLLVSLAWPGALGAQEELPPPKEGPEESFFGSGTGTLVVDGQRRPLPYTITIQGPAVGLAAVVAAVGGELELGPLGQQHVLRIFGDEFILGPDSAVMTLDEQILPLSRPPIAGAGGLEVPLAALEQSYGDRLGYVFTWSSASKTLEVARRGERALRLAVDPVHIAGVTTLVLELGDDARWRAEPTSDGLVVMFPGRTLELTGRPPRAVELIRDVQIGRDRVRLRLAERAEAAEPYRVARGGRVQLVIDVSQRRDPVFRPEPTRELPSRSWQGTTIVLDPGHGGAETGAIGPGGTREKDLTLLLARSLQRRLEARLPVRVVLTRDADTTLDHGTRTAIANQNRAALFLSIHLNSEPGRSRARGAETFFLDSAASDAAAAASAEFENRGLGGGAGSDGAAGSGEDELGIQLILWDLAQSRHLSRSQRLASFIQQELNDTLDLRDRGVKQAPFRVLNGATMPAVLVELGFLSNPEEEALLTDPAYRLSLVDALVDALVRFQALDPEAERAERTASPSGLPR